MLCFVAQSVEECLLGRCLEASHDLLVNLARVRMLHHLSTEEIAEAWRVELLAIG